MTASLLLDTNILTQLLRRNPKVVTQYRAALDGETRCSLAPWSTTRSSAGFCTLER
jgi:hypothetical protein